MQKKIQSIALYLPQFHQTAENNLWWGEGFTDWISVQKSKPIFKGHEQPKKPLNDNYYDLMDKKTMLWQAMLAKKYKIDGFCFYHYWFKDGKKILEKPAENLLMWKDVDMQFCFSWANETWARSWSNVPGKNSWASSFEKNVDFKNGILLEQKYGEEAEWEEHFMYLLPFFKDKRYIKVNNKPVFMIYRPELMLCMKRMVNYWRKRAREEGLPGIYIIGTNVCEYTDALDGVMITMSQAIDSSKYKVTNTNLTAANYPEVWDKYIKQDAVLNMKTFWCAMVNYDDTPRRGENGLMYQNASVEYFRKYYEVLLKKSIEYEVPLIFINAWNEWGEGMYLEPDNKNGYKYLEVIQNVKIEWKDSIKKEKMLISDKYNDKSIQILEKKLNKFKRNYELLHMWLILKQEKKDLIKYFVDRKYKNISIYGYGINGKHLCEELKESVITIKYIIDRQKKVIKAPIPVYDVDDQLPKCEIVIVTVVDEYIKIVEQLEKNVNCPIVSLTEIISESL